MEVKRYNVDPTDENILQSLTNNTYGRNENLRCYLELLDKATDISVFSLNADWGEGKTFFTLQAKMILEYLNPNCKQDEDTKTQLDALFTLPKTAMRKPEMTRTVFPVYYNAWLYDDHKDPLSSFLYFLSVTFQKKYSKLDSNGLRKLARALEIITDWKCGITVDLEKVGEAVTGQDTASKITYLEDAKHLVDEAFHDLLEGNDGLIVFVDEIDRCSPRYAVDFLECIKHFFGCANVQFVFSTNIKQLAETICNVYGAGFDGTRYLNKFFDCSLELPPVDIEHMSRNFGTWPRTYTVNSFAHSLIRSLHLSIRETNDYYGQALLITDRCQKAISNIWFSDADEFSYTCYPITLFALSLTDRKKYDSFKSGTAETLFVSLLQQWEGWQRFVRKSLFRNDPNIPQDETVLIDAVKADYNRVFASVVGRDTELAELRQKIFELASLLG